MAAWTRAAERYAAGGDDLCAVPTSASMAALKARALTSNL
jgi:hypothetical protein